MVDLATEYTRLQQTAQHTILRHPPRTLAAQLSQLAERAQAVTQADVYGRGELIEHLEQRVAHLLGKPAALFFPSGTMAQPLVLKIHSEQRENKPGVLLHPTSHMLLHEQNGLAELWQLEPYTVGCETQPIYCTDLEQLSSTQLASMGSLVLELPAREIGGQLPSWDDLRAQVRWAREQDLAVHFDGARLWHCPGYYQRSLAAIAGLADSVYVSLYKDIGGIAGAILAADQATIDRARIWQRRAGGNLYSYAPFILAAEQGLDDNLAQFERAVQYTQELVHVLGTRSELQHLIFTPNPPQSAMFHVTLPISREALLARLVEYTRATGVVVLSAPRQTTANGEVCEISIGRAALQQTPEFWSEHWVAALKPLLER